MDDRSQLRDPREDNLPKWARDKFAELRNAIAYADRELKVARREALENGATGKIIADGLASEGFPLHDRSCVEFHLPGGKVTCMLRDNGAVLDLNSSGSILIHPRAANSAYVTVA